MARGAVKGPSSGGAARARLRGQESRRKDMLARQKEARRNLTDHGRRLALHGPSGSMAGREEDVGEEEGVEEDWADEGGMCAVDNGMELGFEHADERRGSDSCIDRRRASLKRRRDRWSSELSTPEWLLDVPTDLNGKGSPHGTGWYVVPRPEGKRIIVIAAAGHTTARDLGGAVILRWKSALPGGGGSERAGGGKSGEPPHTILDCVLHPFDGVIYVLDIMSWKDYSLYDCTADFRLYWARTKLAEASVGEVSSCNEHRILTLPYCECDSAGIRWAYETPMPFLRDGLLFFAKQGAYCLGSTPLVLLWKDESTTRYLLSEGLQSVVLMARASDSESIEGEWKLVSGDSVPALLGSLPANAAKEYGIQDGDLARFTVDLVEEDEATGDPVVQGLTFSRICSAVRPAADTFSKAVFQCRLRRGKGVISISDIEAAAGVPMEACLASG